MLKASFERLEDGEDRRRIRMRGSPKAFGAEGCHNGKEKRQWELGRRSER
jgi:hypothetical protein